MKVFDADLPDTRPMILKLAEQKAGQIHKNRYEAPATLGRPQKGMDGYSEVMAMDECFRNVLSRALRSQIQYSAFPLFVGYGMLSNLAQEALIRAGVETIADEMTRKNIQLYYDEDGNDKEKLINDLNSEMVKFKIRERMNEALLKDGYFGGCLVYIDVGDLEDDEKEEPLILDKKTFKAGSFRGLKVIEPVNICPGTYNTTDPTDEHYFNPEFWYILGKRYHASRFLYIASNETPLLLKPAYNFFGIPQAQLALDYVAHFVSNRESAQELLNKFSLTCFGTDMSQGLQQNGSWADLINRMKMFNKMKTNNGTFVYNKETEELSQINTPLSGVRDIVEMSLNLLTAVWRIPKIKYIGEGEGGLNASSKEQMRSYYDYIGAMQEKVLTNPYTTILKIIQLNKGLDPDEKLLFKFPVLWDMDDQERAALNKQQADRDAIYLANGVLSQEEVRQRLSLDRNSEYTMIDVDDVPEPTEEPLKDADREEQDETDREAMDMAMDSVNVYLCPIKESFLGKISCVFDNNFNPQEKRDSLGMWTNDISDVEWRAIKKAKVVDISDLVKENITKKEIRDFIRNAMNEANYGAVETSNPDWFIDFQGNKKERMEIEKSSRYKYLEKHPDEKNRRDNYVLAIKRIIPNAVYGIEAENTKKDKKENIEKYHYFYSKVKINKDVFLVKIDASQRVGEKEEKPQKVHLYDIIEKSREKANP